MADRLSKRPPQWERQQRGPKTSLQAASAKHWELMRCMCQTPGPSGTQRHSCSRSRAVTVVALRQETSRSVAAHGRKHKAVYRRTQAAERLPAAPSPQTAGAPMDNARQRKVAESSRLRSVAKSSRAYGYHPKRRPQELLLRCCRKKRGVIV